MNNAVYSISEMKLPENPETLATAAVLMLTKDGIIFFHADEDLSSPQNMTATALFRAVAQGDPWVVQKALETLQAWEESPQKALLTELEGALQALCDAMEEQVAEAEQPKYRRRSHADVTVLRGGCYPEDSAYWQELPLYVTGPKDPTIDPASVVAWDPGAFHDYYEAV